MNRFVTFFLLEFVQLAGQMFNPQPLPAGQLKQQGILLLDRPHPQSERRRPHDQHHNDQDKNA